MFGSRKIYREGNVGVKEHEFTGLSVFLFSSPFTNIFSPSKHGKMNRGDSQYKEQIKTSLVRIFVLTLKFKIGNFTKKMFYALASIVMQTLHMNYETFIRKFSILEFL